MGISIINKINNHFRNYLSLLSSSCRVGAWTYMVCKYSIVTYLQHNIVDILFIIL